MVQGNPPTTQPEVVADPPAGEANGPNGPGPIPIPHGNLGQQPIHDDQEDQFPLLQEDFGMGHVPPKFKVPVFDKYNGNSCPKTHVQAYFCEMIAYSDNEKLLMYFFQDSLAGASLEWYMRLYRAHIRCWRDLAEAFVKQYQYNADMAPDRTQL
ncbi:hypothetical protein KIW84_064693 [Lathyrus oleraceus]|uniref:Retrotransposon gag domain-containing protein n=1 Tax=Pisum sativum TaxID=3888 RepID=A0A9D4WF11_PEA|nr:hypothetical protein KIW84_064693 [Pisum sativum]